MENSKIGLIKKYEEEGDVNALEELKQEADASFEGDIAGLADAAISRISEAARELDPLTSRAFDLGDNEANLADQTSEVDNNIKETAQTAKQKIEQFKNPIAGFDDGKPEEALLKEKVGKMRSIDDAQTIEEMMAYNEKLKQGFIELGNKNAPKILELLKTIDTEKLREIYKLLIDGGWNSQQSEQERDAVMQQELENCIKYMSSEKPIKGISNKILFLIGRLSEISGENKDFALQLKEDATEQDKKAKENSRIVAFKEFKGQIEQDKGKSFIIDCLFSPNISWTTVDEKSDPLRLAKQLGIISEQDIENAIKEFISSKITTSKDSLEKNAPFFISQAKEIFGDEELMKQQLLNFGIVTSYIKEKVFEEKVEV